MAGRATLLAAIRRRCIPCGGAAVDPWGTPRRWFAFAVAGQAIGVPGAIAARRQTVASRGSIPARRVRWRAGRGRESRFADGRKVLRRRRPRGKVAEALITGG